MRSAVLGIAILALGLGVFRFALPALIEDAIDGGSDDCDSAHLTSKDLEPLVPEEAPGFEEVYRSVQHCKSRDIPSEAELNLAYAALGTVETTARAMLSKAESDGWTRVSPAAGKPPTTQNGAASLALKRPVDGKTVHFDVSVFASASRPNPNPNANISRIQATGSPTGVLVRIWVESKSAVPTIDPGKLGIFGTPDVGIGR